MAENSIIGLPNQVDGGHAFYGTLSLKTAQNVL